MSTAPVTTPVTTPNKALLTWEDPARTGKVFGGIVATLIVFKTVNLFNVFFHVAYLGLTVAAAAEYAGKLVTGQGFVTKYKPAAKSYAKQFNSEVLPQVARCSEKFEEQIQKVIYAHDIEVTLKAAGLSYVLYKVTSWFSLYTLVFAGVVLTFTLPAVYVHNKKEIDAAVTQYTKLAKDKASELSAAAHKKAGPHFDTLVKKTGPLGSFINSKIPVRTAGSTVGTETNGYKEPTSAHTTGASKFPEVPSSADDSILDEFDDAADTSKVEVPVRL